MARRSSGEGTITKLPSGNYRAQIRVGDNRRLSYTAKTQREASTWLKRTAGQVEQGLTYTNAKMTMGDLINDWLAIKSTRIRQSTLEQYQRMVRIYLVPGVGEIKLKDMSSAHLQGFYSDLLASGVGRRTIEINHTILHGCLQHGLRVGVVTQNWASLVEAPRPMKKEMEIWTESQVSHFLASVPEPTNYFYRLAFATGMRRGELIGLQWQDLDWQSESIMIRRQVFTPQGGGFIFQEPKTARGKRVIRLGPGLLQALRVQFNQVLPLARGIAGDRWKENDLIFPSTVGNPRQGYDVSKSFKRLASDAGLPTIRFHDIRHTAASIMLLHGEPPVRVAGILGQSVAVLLDTYAHYIPDDQTRAAMLMDEITTPVIVDLSDSSGTRMAHARENDAK
jgi:integrase